MLLKSLAYLGHSFYYSTFWLSFLNLLLFLIFLSNNGGVVNKGSNLAAFDIYILSIASALLGHRVYFKVKRNIVWNFFTRYTVENKLWKCICSDIGLAVNS